MAREVLVGQNHVQQAGLAPSAAVDASAFLAELARAVDSDLSTPDHAPATERAYAHDWDDYAAFCGRHALESLPTAPQTLALYLKALETRRSRSPAGIRAGTVAFRSRRCAGGWPRSRADTQSRGSSP